jgi:REP element-mobilizing transposase RayT
VVKQRPTLGQVIRAYKATVTRRIRKKGEKEFTWQRNYFEHIIRSERTLNEIRQYIKENPTRWDLDRYNPNASGLDPQSKALWNLLESDHF